MNARRRWAAGWAMLLVLLAACEVHRDCRPGTVYLTVTFLGQAALATKIDVTASRDGGPAVPLAEPLAHSAGAPTATYELLVKNYTPDSTLSLTLTAQVGSQVVTSKRTVTLPPTCAATNATLGDSVDAATGAPPSGAPSSDAGRDMGPPSDAAVLMPQAHDANDDVPSSSNPDTKLNTSGTGSPDTAPDVASSIDTKPPPPPAKTALLVQREDGIGEGSSLMLERLMRRSFTVTQLKQDNLGTASLKDYALIVVSPHATLATTGQALKGVTAGVFLVGSPLYGEMGMTGPYNGGPTFGVFPQEYQLTITMPHPLAGGLSGMVSVFTAAKPGVFLWGNPALAATVVATAGSPPYPVIFGYDKGAMMVGMTAPGRRVGWFGVDVPPPVETPAWDALFDAAALWAAGFSQ